MSRVQMSLFEPAVGYWSPNVQGDAGFSPSYSVKFPMRWLSQSVLLLPLLWWKCLLCVWKKGQLHTPRASVGPGQLQTHRGTSFP